MELMKRAGRGCEPLQWGCRWIWSSAGHGRCV